MKRENTQARTVVFDLQSRGNDDAIPCVLSTDAVVDVADGPEILVHTSDAIDMRRAPIPIVVTHRENQLNVGNVDDLHIIDGTLRGMARFGARSEALEYKTDVINGTIRSLSVRYRRINAAYRKDGVLVTTKWMPMHAAMVAEPADTGAGFYRDQPDELADLVIEGEEVIKPAITAARGTAMTTNTTATGGEDDGGNVNVVMFREARKSAQIEGEKSGAQRERERIAEIEGVFAAFGGPDYTALRGECIAKGSTADQARKALLDLVALSPEGQATSNATRSADTEGARAAKPPRFEAGRDGGEKLAEGIQKSIEMRAGMLSAEEMKRETGHNEFAGMTLVEMIRAWGQRNGIRVNHPTASQMVGHVMSEGKRIIGMGTSDFAGIVANVAGKALLQGWEENPSTYRAWCRIGSVNDFRRVNRTGLSGMDLLSVVPEHAEYTHGNASDRTEYLTAAAYGKLFSLSRAAILADDIAAFSAIPRGLGRAADLTVNKTVYDLLISQSGTGPTLNQDSVALFHTATHANYITSSGGAPSVARLEVGRAAMAVQTDPNNAMPLNIQPKYLLSPSALSSTSMVLVASEKDPLGTASATGGATTPNPFYNKLTVITEPYLDVSGGTKATTAWYLIADQNMHDTFEVAFVGGQQSPYLESRDGWTVDGIEYKVRLEFGVAALDWRGMFRNDGD